MLSARNALFAAAFVLPMGTGACKPKSESVAPADGAQTAPSTTDSDGVGPGPSGAPAKMLHVQASVEGIDDMLAALKDLNARLEPDDTSDPMADMQASLLQMGFGPGFMQSLDLTGLHALTTSFPSGGEAGPNDTELSATLAVVDARKLIESTPPAFRPQPLGDGVWELKQENMKLLMREAGKELLVGMDNQDLDEAGKLRGKIGEGRRIRARAWNIPTDNIDAAQLLELPKGMPMVDNLNKVVKGLKALEFEADFGTKRDFEALTSMEAPMHELGLQPIGEPRAAATGLEGKLPGRPVFVTTIAWGDLKSVHQLLDQNVPLQMVPQPFTDIAKTAIDGMHGIVDQLGADTVLGIYLDKKGQGTILLAADVKDEAKATEAMRKLNDAILRSGEAQAQMAGKNKDAAFGVEFKTDSVKLGKVKADRLAITVPKDFEGDFDEFKIFMSKNKIETLSMVGNGTAVVLIGAGGRAMAGDIAKSLGKARKTSLATSPGLEKVRKTLGGCQICMAGDPIEYFRLRLQLIAATTEDKAVAKEAKSALARLGKVSAISEPGAGLKVERERASFGVVVPESTVFAPSKTLTELGAIYRFIDDPQTSLTAKAEPKPGKTEETPGKTAEKPAKDPEASKKAEENRKRNPPKGVQPTAPKK